MLSHLNAGGPHPQQPSSAPTARYPPPMHGGGRGGLGWGSSSLLPYDATAPPGPYDYQQPYGGHHTMTQQHHHPGAPPLQPDAYAAYQLPPPSQYPFFAPSFYTNDEPAAALSDGGAFGADGAHGGGLSVRSNRRQVGARQVHTHTIVQMHLSGLQNREVRARAASARGGGGPERARADGKGARDELERGGAPCPPSPTARRACGRRLARLSYT